MIKSLVNKVIGDPHQRYIKKLDPQLSKIEKLGKDLLSLHDKDLVAKTNEFRERLKNGETLDELLAEAFAVCREACDRRLGMMNVFKKEHGFDFSKLSPRIQDEAKSIEEALQTGAEEWTLQLSGDFYQEIRQLYPNSVRPFRMFSFPVQLIGGIVLHNGCIGEMATGEGKTLAAACPVYLNGLSGNGVHVVTVNDYLASRDAETMGLTYKFLGLTVGLIVSQLENEKRRESYACDITYGTNNEFGFDYLRDNMAIEKAQLVQRDLNYCIIDEVDSILIDEARTPLIISGPAQESTDRYAKANSLVRLLKDELHYTVDEKTHSALLTDEGIAFAERFLGIENLYGNTSSQWVHHITQALRAHKLYEREKEYVVEEGEVVIVDENTGRKMTGRRYSDGLHQAIEAKENLEVRRENQTLASITFQNYFLMYNKLSGMTGTADTESEELYKIYKLRVVVIPTNRPCIRQDLDDLVFPSLERKLDAVVNDLKERHERGQPVLIGTISIEKSEVISARLKKEGIPHKVLNAKQHEREADIILSAGQKGRVTIATNMAGRGTDIVLGEGVPELGGLYVLATERHESRRIDNQLRGRAGRQGDQGESRYYLSGEDDLLRIFGGDRFKNMMEKMDDGEALSHGLLNRAIKTAQKRVENQNFESRKYLLEYDGVMNLQRRTIYSMRRKILDGEDIRAEVRKRFEEAVDIKLSEIAPPGTYPEDWDLKLLEKELQRSFEVEYDTQKIHTEHLSAEQILDELTELCWAKFERLVDILNDEDLESLKRRVMLMTIDQVWKEHLYSMDHLKDSIRYQGYAQKDPLQVYKKEGKALFEGCLDTIAVRVTETLTRLRVRTEEPNTESTQEKPERKEAPRRVSRIPAEVEQVQKDMLKKIGRNDPCPCGSGKKYKKCHGVDE